MDLKYILLIMGLLLLIAPGAALDGYAYNQSVSYSACDQSVYQQDVVIHRSAGTNYEETVGGLNVWHLYIGNNCQEDYGDVRFTNAAGQNPT